MRTKQGKLYKALVESEVPEIFEELHIEQDGSLKIRVYGRSKDVLLKITGSLKTCFYSKPHVNDVANAVLVLAQNIPLEELADTLEALKRRKPQTNPNVSEQG